jgi:hypothetical protein
VRGNQLETAAWLIEHGADPLHPGTSDTLLVIARDRGEMQTLLERAITAGGAGAPAVEPIAAAALSGAAARLGLPQHPPGDQQDLTRDEAQSLVARMHGVPTWSELVAPADADPLRSADAFALPIYWLLAARCSFPPLADVISFTRASVTFGSSPSVCPFSCRTTSATIRPSRQPAYI